MNRWWVDRYHLQVYLFYSGLSACAIYPCAAFAGKGTMQWYCPSRVASRIRFSIATKAIKAVAKSPPLGGRSRSPRAFPPSPSPLCRSPRGFAALCASSRSRLFYTGFPSRRIYLFLFFFPLSLSLSSASLCAPRLLSLSARLIFSYRRRRRWRHGPARRRRRRCRLPWALTKCHRETEPLNLRTELLLFVVFF